MESPPGCVVHLVSSVAASQASQSTDRRQGRESDYSHRDDGEKVEGYVGAWPALR